MRNATLTKFCKDKGIVQEFSAARTPQHSGVVERKNRTLVEVVRTMLQDAKLPTSFWEEAVNNACYTQHRYLIKKNLGKSPYSILYKRQPTVKHLHVFRSKCYVLKDNSKYVGKFDSKVFEAIFLGYSLDRTAYKVYVLEQKKIMESTYVTFDEDKCPGLECLNENEAETLKFENVNIDSDSEDEAEVNTNLRIDEESTEQVNHENGSSSQTPEFDSTNSGGEREEEVEPKKIEEALLDPDWISSMQEELNQFKRNKVWELVPAPKNISVIGTKLVLGTKWMKMGLSPEIKQVQIYVNDIIFGSTNEKLRQRFSKLMQSEYKMSMMGELSYFLELQVSQRSDGIFIIQTKYVKDLLKNFGMVYCSPASTPMSIATKLDEDKKGKSVDISGYRGMIGSLLYLPASRADIMFATCLCVRFQTNPKESHLMAAKKIFRYLKGTPNMRLWYPKGTGFEAV
ncbi:hypothetical protein AgCh_005919 [Apium graveolens]